MTFGINVISCCTVDINVSRSSSLSMSDSTTISSSPSLAFSKMYFKGGATPNSISTSSSKPRSINKRWSFSFRTLAICASLIARLCSFNNLNFSDRWFFFCSLSFLLLISTSSDNLKELLSPSPLVSSITRVEKSRRSCSLNRFSRLNSPLIIESFKASALSNMDCNFFKS